MKIWTYSTTGETQNNYCFINWELVININILYLISGSAYQKLSWTVDNRAIFLYSSQTVRTLDYTHVKQTTCLVILNRPLCWLCKVLSVGNRLLWVEASVNYLTVTCVILYGLHRVASKITVYLCKQLSSLIQNFHYMHLISVTQLVGFTCCTDKLLILEVRSK